MANPLHLNNQSALEAALEWLSRPRNAVLDVVKGHPAGALRQLGDFALDPIDALIPGDVIPQLSRPEDYTNASDLVGGMEPGLAKSAVDILGNTALDPLTYVGVGPVAKGLGMAGKAGLDALHAIPAIDPVVTTAEGLAKNVAFQARRATGTLMPDPANADIVAGATAKGGATRMAAQGNAVEAFRGVDPVTQRRAIETIRGVSTEMPGTTGAVDIDALAGLPPRTTQYGDMAEQMARIDARLAALPWAPAEKAAVRDTAEKAIGYTRGQWEQGVRDKVFGLPAGVSPQHAPLDYLPGSYEMEQAANDAAKAGQPALIGAKQIRSSADLATFLNTPGKAGKNPTLDTDLPTLLGDYGARMGQAVKAAEVGQKIAPTTFKALADEGSRGDVKTAIDALEQSGKRDDAEILRVAFSGLPPREGLLKILATANKWFKPFATGGAFIPRPAFTTRNVVSSAEQILSNPEARSSAAGALMRAPKDIIGAWSDGLRQLGLPMPQPAHVSELENAIKVSGGDRQQMLAAIRDPTLRDAVRTGVLDSGFVTSEQLGATLAQQAKGVKDWRNWRDWPQGIVRGAEDRMRLGLFTDLMKKGKTAEQAAKVVKDSLYDYAYASTLNRSMRDVIPFFQFSAKAIPQQAKFLAEKGIVPSLARNSLEDLYGQGQDAVLPPQLQDAAAIPFGRDEQNNPEYLTSFGMPFESLAQIPNLTGDLGDIGPELRQNVVSQATPPLKSLYSLVTGNDPYFGTPFASYDNAPYAGQALGLEPHSELARGYNVLAGSGAIQPLSAPISTISGLLDPRRTPGEAALNTLTGVRIKSVDEEQATRQLLEQALTRDPSVQRYETLYQKDPNEETQAMLEALKEVKRVQAKKRHDAKAAAGVH